MQIRSNRPAGGRGAQISGAGKRLLFILMAITAFAAESADSRWVQGSWVNVRSEASAKGEVITKLTANTQVNVLSTQGEWCEVSAKAPDVRGFMACQLLGKKPLLLAEVGTPPPHGAKPDPRYSPTRAFWLAPSVARLQAAGDFFWSTMINDTQRQKENPQGNEAGNERPAPVRFPIPEFDAMKALLQNGVVAAEERRPALIPVTELIRATAGKPADAIQFSGRWIDGGALALLHQARLNPVKPSLFRRATEVAPAGTAVEELSAQFGIRERLRVLSGPQWVHYRHENPYVKGNWDIGSFEIALEKPVIEYVVGRQGLAAALEWPATATEDVHADYACPDGFGIVPRAKHRLPDYPQVKDPLLWIYTPKALPYKKAAIKTYAKRLEPPTGNSRPWQGTALSLLVMHEIDLDGDGIADLMAWEGMGPLAMGGGPDSGDTAMLRVNFVNIAGQWHLLNIDSYSECT